MIGLSVDAVDKWAKDSKLENADTVRPAIANNMVSTSADFEMDPEDKNGILYQSDSFWQRNVSDLLGTLVHEFAHLEHPALEDTDLQFALFGPKGVDPNDTTNISRKITKDWPRKILSVN